MIYLGILSTLFYGYCVTHFYYSYKYNINLLNVIKKYNTTGVLDFNVDNLNNLDNLKRDSTILINFDLVTPNEFDSDKNNFSNKKIFRNSLECKNNMLYELRNRFNKDNTDIETTKKHIFDNYELIN